MLYVEAKFACNAYDELREKNDERKRDENNERLKSEMAVDGPSTKPLLFLCTDR